MINPATIGFANEDDTKYFVLIEPVLEKAGDTLKSTGVYKLYKDAIGDESALFTEPREMTKSASTIPDEANPDYLGKITIKDNEHWTYAGDLLNRSQQEQVAAYLQQHR